MLPGGHWAVNGCWNRAASEDEYFGACPEDVVKEVPRGEGVKDTSTPKAEEVA